MKKGKFLSIALAMLLALTTLFAACDCKNNDGPGGGNTGKQGIHGGTVEETNDYIVKDGKSDYVVVYDKLFVIAGNHAARALYFLEIGRAYPRIRGRAAVNRVDHRRQRFVRHRRVVQRFYNGA